MPDILLSIPRLFWFGSSTKIDWIFFAVKSGLGLTGQDNDKPRGIGYSKTSYPDWSFLAGRCLDLTLRQNAENQRIALWSIAAVIACLH